MRSRRFRRSAVLAMLAVLGVAACNTMEGAGKDVKAGGQSIEDSAARNKNY